MQPSNNNRPSSNSGRPYGNPQPSRQDELPPLDTNKIQLADPQPELFDKVANDTAKAIAQAKKEVNKPTQLRKFYDEIVMWDQRVKQNKDGYNQFLPLIKMINAKVAYAEGRELVDKNFTQLMRCCLDQVKPDQPQTLHHCKLFFEAFMGFFKLHRPK